ncbi:MAG: hypothetical protein M3Z35_00070 [Nitrospirota bacterium]|nr:hypothetical protein [Nitrospirota bacterium]
MPYAFSQNMPSSKDMYDGLSDRIGDGAPKGLIVHLAFETPTGMRVVDVWESEEEFDLFQEKRLRPAMDQILQKAGITRESLHIPQEEELKPVEIFGATFPKRRF